MRKIAEKVALVAQICVAVVFVIVAMLYALGIVPQVELQNNAVVAVVMIVLAVIFVGTSVYILYMNFSELQNIKRVLLYADSKCATTASLKVVNKIARGCADKIDGVHIKKTKIRADEKKGYVATFYVQVSAGSVTPVLDQLRCLIEDSFKDALGLVFNTIAFEIIKLTNQHNTNVDQAKKRAQTITESTDQVQDDCENPTVEPAEEQTDLDQVATDETAVTTASDITEEQTDTSATSEEKEPVNA